MLSDTELQVARSKMAKLTPGIYTVRALYGADWEANPRPRCFGKRFTAAVFRGDLPGLRWVRQRSDRSQEYEVRPADAANHASHEPEEVAA